jgi:predicted amidohydrolase
MMKLAIAERWPEAGDLSARIAAAAAAGAELVLLPEALPGTEPELSDGPTAQLLAGLARDAGIAILAGYVETCITGIYNAALLVDRRGVCVANYRQAHARAPEQGGRDPGHWLTIMTLGERRLGILLGYDIEFPEAARALALSGCDLLAVLGGGSDEAAAVYLAARARENRTWLAYAGEGACLLAPDGGSRATPDAGSGLVLGRVDPHPASERAQADLALHRQPRLYRALLHGLEDEARPD